MNKLKMHVVLTRNYVHMLKLKQFSNSNPILTLSKTYHNKRRCLSRLRLSAHNLEVETGSFGKHPILREERHCSFCLATGLRVLGDEFHLLLVCPEFADKRCYLVDELQRTAPDLKQLTS